MYQKDFILRIIEELFKFLSVLLKLKKEGNYEEALILIEKATQNLTHINLSEIDSIPCDAIVDFVVEKKLNDQPLEALAILLMERGEVYFEMNNRFSAIANLDKSLALFQLIDQTTKTYSQERETNVSKIRYRLSQIIDNSGK